MQTYLTEALQPLATVSLGRFQLSQRNPYSKRLWFDSGSPLWKKLNTNVVQALRWENTNLSNTVLKIWSLENTLK